MRCAFAARVHRAMATLGAAGVWPHDAHVKVDLLDAGILWAEPYGVARRFRPTATEREIGDWLGDVAEAARTTDLQSTTEDDA